MARTFRRNKQHLIISACGTLSEAQNDSWWLNRRFPGVPVEVAYERYVARYRSDHAKGMFGIPHWFNREHSTVPRRRHDRREIHRCIRLDCWDDHAPIQRKHPRPWYW